MRATQIIFKIFVLAGLLISAKHTEAQKLKRFYENAKVGYKDESGKVIVPAK